MSRMLVSAAAMAAAMSVSACASTMNDDSAMDSGAMSSSSMSSSSMASTSGTVMVGGAAMYPTKTIVENAQQSADHTTLVSAVVAADLAGTLSGPGPFTVFAPTNTAFGKLPAGTVDTLVMPANKAMLTKVLTYHVVPSKLTAADLTNGRKLKTVQGGELTVMRMGGMVHLRDAKGGESMVTIADVNQSNGVIHVVNTVLMPAG